MSSLAARFDARHAWTWPALTAAAAIGWLTAWDARVAALVLAAALAPVLVWTDPRVTLALLAAALGLNLDVLSAPVHVSLPQLIALALLGGALVRTGRVQVRPGLVPAAGVLFVLSTLPSLVPAAHRTAALAGTLQLLVPALLLAVVVRLLAARPGTADRLGPWLLLGAMLSVVPAVVQVTFGIGPAGFRAGSMMRAYATFTQPNTYGLYLAGMLPLAVGWALATRQRVAFVAAGALGLALVLTGSRGAWAGALLGLIAVYLTMVRLRMRVLAGGLVALLGLLMAVALIPDDLILGRFDFTDWSAQQRLLILLTAWDGILRSPLLGHGAGSFEAMLPSIARQGLIDDVATPHNLLLHIWFELGLLALLCFVLLSAVLLIRTFRAARQRRDPRLAGVLGALVGMLAAAMFGTLFIRGVQETFVLFVALAAAMTRRHNDPGPVLHAHSVPV